jgi:hypothetical protein
MKRSPLRLLVAAVLFVGWMSWLVYLAATGTDDVVLSRPQFLVANVHLVATVQDERGAPAARVTVKKVYWATGVKDKLDGQITVENLPECLAGQGWTGPGEYILPLLTNTSPSGVTFQVAPTPRTPGYPYGRNQPANRPGPPRIYPVTPSRLRQLEQIEETYKQEFSVP